MVTIWIILVVYMLINLAIGFYSGKKIKNSSDYLLAGRNIGVLLTAGTLAATEVGGGSTVGVAAKAYGSWGLSAGWYVTAAGIGVILVSFIAPMLRRSMATTMPEIIERRFGNSSHIIALILSLSANIALAGVQITASATIISVLTGLSTNWGILLSGIVLVFYTMIGGMWSVTLTDIVHAIVLLAGFTIAVPFAIHNAGGWNHVVGALPQGQLGFTKVGWKTIIGLIIMYFMTFSTGQECVQRLFAAKDEKTAVKGSMLCGILMALYSFIPAILGLVALAVFPHINPNNAIATVSTNLIPHLIAGLVMAAVISATLSSGSGDLLGASTVFVKDIYQHYINPKVSDEHLMHYSKTAVLVFGIIAICISLFSKQIIPMLVFAFTMRSAGPFAAFIFGLTWKNVTKHAGILSIILGSIAGFWWQYLNEPFGIMAVIVGSVVSVITFIIVFEIEKALGHPLIPLHISQK
ncbi:sodium:solute symporter family protein [Clostridium tyrobutyricum]|uniref:sodium:solute symporter family protein n=1 Tax=Clostridium tyrobutyricum TaxID=1519 RepID=UPI001C38941F|nr:sodium:solute symporter family protein [Clostridium tyrobutyricum]MBV4416441.1 sodium:solute symporter family protein [Clostridium tyrobutyricum]MBV4423611.1 sodium:solute symporter family protein [Clostridium tyrobutyricum]